MPPEFSKAHQLNDAAVMEACGFRIKNEQTGKSRWLTESETVVRLMQIDQELKKWILTRKMQNVQTLIIIL